MKTNLAYIDDVMDRAIAGEVTDPKLPAAAKEAAAKKGQRLIGGFRVFDEEAEKRELDALIKQRHKTIEDFKKKRDALRELLGSYKVQPLATLPTGAWHKICLDAQLYRLHPTKEGKVYYNGKALRDNYTRKDIDRIVARYPKNFLENIFPGFVMPASGAFQATLVLPDPPKEVAGILLRVHEKFAIKVAAVAEAIRLAETPSELWDASGHPRDAWARAQGYEDYADWVKRDPIIYVEDGNVTAIIAQFGDFPIEKETVDQVVAASEMFLESPLTTLSPTNADIDGAYQRLMLERQRLSTTAAAYSHPFTATTTAVSTGFYDPVTGLYYG